MLSNKKSTVWGLLFALFIFFSSCAPKDDDEAVRALAKRLIPKYEKNFVFNVVEDSLQYSDYSGVEDFVIPYSWGLQQFDICRTEPLSERLVSYDSFVECGRSD